MVDIHACIYADIITDIDIPKKNCITYTHFIHLIISYFMFVRLMTLQTHMYAINDDHPQSWIEENYKLDSVMICSVIVHICAKNRRNCIKYMYRKFEFQI